MANETGGVGVRVTVYMVWGEYFDGFVVSDIEYDPDLVLVAASVALVGDMWYDDFHILPWLPSIVRTEDEGGLLYVVVVTSMGDSFEVWADSVFEGYDDAISHFKRKFVEGRENLRVKGGVAP